MSLIDAFIKRAIYLVRDVRDVLLSAYAMDSTTGMALYHSHGRGFDGYIETFLKGKVAHQGSWQNHVNSWMDSPLAGSDNLLLIRFEDMRRNTESTVTTVLDFLEFSYDLDKVRAAIANNSLERMRAKEEILKRSGVKLDKKVLIRDLTVENEEGRFVRKGAIAGWRNKLTEPQLRLIEQRTGATLLRMGYELASSAQAAYRVSMIPCESLKSDCFSYLRSSQHSSAPCRRNATEPLMLQSVPHRSLRKLCDSTPTICTSGLVPQCKVGLGTTQPICICWERNTTPAFPLSCFR